MGVHVVHINHFPLMTQSFLDYDSSIWYTKIDVADRWRIQLILSYDKCTLFCFLLIKMRVYSIAGHNAKQ